MSEAILNEILVNVKETNEKVLQMDEKMDEKLEIVKKEINENIEEKMDEKLEIVKKEINENIEEKMDEKLEIVKKEINENIEEKMNDKLNNVKKEIIDTISSDIGKELNQVMIVISKVEKEKQEKISKQIEQHEKKAIRGVELLRATLVS